ncbi:hypothetical protein HHL22_06370 [Hymenobacter sp. RP-2-7]|uniref:Uncharacterized protein n=1 Tax=Hymenobacter polaris TaxID=2682546 RepID=A0A7Y0ACH7_9BACT|nr:hypothetical protein [Hymenobacter polaris]NML64826.1 hypothetical protein [Hymenobacter polaris]
MKTSNLLLLIAALVLLGSLTAYNMALRAEYRSGTYKDPLREYSRLKFKDFDEVAVPAASAAGVKIVAGSFGVRLSPDAAKYLHVTQQGRRLVVSAVFPEQWHWLPNDAVVISCPRLAALSADAVAMEAGKRVEDTRIGPRYRVLVQGFGQDTLRVQADRSSRIELAANRLGYLAAETGRTPGSHTALLLDDDNHIAAASLRCDNLGTLELNGVRIPRLHTQLGDSVQLSLRGQALGALVQR